MIGGVEVQAITWAKEMTSLIADEHFPEDATYPC